MSSQDLQCISNGILSFSTTLYHALSREKNNIFFSPISANATISLLYQGASGKTAEILKETLDLPNPEIAAEGYKRLLEELNSIDKANLVMANKMYVQENRQLKPEFETMVTENFRFETENVKFQQPKITSDKINRWVEEKTNQTIEDLIKPEDLDALARLVLINAIYFNGKWLNAFHPANTTKQKFYVSDLEKVDCDMMHVSGDFNYQEVESLDAQIISVPYKNENLSMFIFLPSSRAGIKNLENKLLSGNLEEANKNLRKVPVDLSLPKFKMETSMELRQPLTHMGLGILFTLEAEFYNMFVAHQPIHVTKVIQTTFIEINEEGTEDAISTATPVIGMCCAVQKSPPQPRFEFTANHPFVFAICFEHDGIIFPIFVGKVHDPRD